MAGAALVGLGVWGIVRDRRAARGGDVCSTKSIVAVGLVHGLTGAAALLLLLPAIVSDSNAYRAVYLGAFSVGSTLAMAALTAALARISSARRCTSWAQRRLPAVASACSVRLGAR